MKNLNKSAAIFLALVFLSVSLKAQKTPGYRGKHFMFGYGVNISHNLFDTYRPTVDQARVHLRHSVHAEMLVNRFVTAGAEIDYISFNSGKRGVRISNTEEKFYNTRDVCMAAGIYVKQYFGTGGLIAPLGNYYKLRLFAEKMYVENTSAENTFKSDKYFSPGIGYAFGKSRILYNSVKIDGSLELNLLLGALVPALDIFKRDGRYYKANEMAFHHALNYGTSVKFCVSGLLF